MKKGLSAFISISLVVIMLSCQPGHHDELTHHIHVPAGFVVEHLHFPSDSTLNQGSWVSLCKDDKGRLIASDQYGYLYRITPPPIGSGHDRNGSHGENSHSGIKVEKIPVKLGHAQGLLWAFNSLYVSVNTGEGIDGKGSGFYRLTDTNGDDMLDKAERLKSFEGSGEHGPHAIRLSPDSTSLYVLGGNHTNLPEGFTSVLPSNWQEDNLLPVIKDPRGHANDRTAPGGWIAVTDPNGKSWQIVSSGYRNSYDMDFTEDGELLVFDSDMEWDLGMPWYRPIRVVHATMGSEFGWRTGSGKWSPAYPDNLPPVVNIGQGSPTGVVMGKGLKFPTEYQRGVFIMDWSFGTMYFISLFPEGSTYRGEKEEFLSGIPLPLTDMVVGDDGAMYFTTGGRRVESHLYRVYYDGEEEPTQLEIVAGTHKNNLFEKRRNLEKALWKVANTDSLPDYKASMDTTMTDLFWEHLGHEDRFIRYTSRVGLENLTPQLWHDRYEGLKDANRIIEGAVALSRMEVADMKPLMLAKLSNLDWGELDEIQRHGLIRAYSLIFIRLGDAVGPVKETIIDQLMASYPSNSAELNMEQARILSYLEAPGVVPKTLALIRKSGERRSETPYLAQEVILRSEQYGPTIAEMLANMPAREEISYVRSLSHVKTGWTMEQRREYFQWFADALERKGGMSYRGFIDRIRLDAMEHLSNEEKYALSDVSEQFIAYKAVNFAELPQPKGPGNSYSMSDLRRILRERENQPRNFEVGKNLYAAALCASCHTMGAEGGNVGPNLTQAHTRFSTNEMLWAIMAPSDMISDQYAATKFTLEDGKVVTGRFVDEQDGEIYVNTNPYDLHQSIKIDADQVVSRENSPVSTMPPGLLNKLNPEEVADLMAYLMAGGNENSEVYN